MILKENSVLHFLPQEIEKRQFLIFDAIRFSLEIIDNAYDSLKNELLSLSEKKGVKKDLPKLYNELSIIIDNSVKIINLYKLLGIENHSVLFKTLEYVKFFRHTFQHIDERVDEYLLESSLPIHGVLSWNYSNPNTQKVEVFITPSGIAKYKLQYKIVKENLIHRIKFIQ